MSFRKIPNIIITGTPGCGKTSHSKGLVKALGEGYTHYNISEFGKENDLIESYDERLDTSVLDEDKLLDILEPKFEIGGCIIDWHVCAIFPERLIDLVVVLTTDNSILHDRLSARGYKDNKIQENIDAEIMQVILEEARESYAPEIVVELKSETEQDKSANVERLGQWVQNWLTDHPDGASNAKRPAREESDSEESDGEESAESEATAESEASADSEEESGEDEDFEGDEEEESAAEEEEDSEEDSKRKRRKV